MCVDTGQHHREVDRLGHIVVGAKLQCFDDIRAFRLGGDHDDGQLGLRPALTQTAQHLEAAHAGHPHIEQNEIVLTGRRALERRRAVGGRVDPEALLYQKARQHVPVEVGVVDDEDRTGTAHATATLPLRSDSIFPRRT